MNYPPFEEALTLFYARMPAGARPQRILAGAPELDQFAAWVEHLPAARNLALDGTTPAAYDGVPVDCASAESYAPAVE